MKDVVKTLEFVKHTYNDENIKKQIDNSIAILNGEKGLKSQKVIEMIKALKVAYDDDSMKVKFDEAIRILEAA